MRNPLVVGTRVYLRPLETSDAAEIAWHSATEPETFMERWRRLASPLAFEHWITELHKKSPPRHISLAVCLIADDTLLGDVGVGEIDWVNRNAETAAWIGRADYRGGGYGTEAKHLLLKYAFDHLHLHVLHSWVWEPNTRSAAALLKQGYRPAGRLRWDDIQHGVFRDALIFDVLRDEWLAAREEWRRGLASRAGESASADAGEPSSPDHFSRAPEEEETKPSSNATSPSPAHRERGAGG
jgi:RimJ/RimL family protein N-acetyltransferase